MQSRVPQPRKIRWNRLVILVAGVLGLLLLCCVAVAALAPNLRRIIQAPFWKTDAQLAAQAAHKMFDYDPPPDYQLWIGMPIRPMYMMGRRFKTLSIATETTWPYFPMKALPKRTGILRT